MRLPLTFTAVTRSPSPLRDLMLWGCAILVLPSFAHGAEHKPPKTDAEKIANAMSAAPSAVSRNASIVEMNEDGSMKVLRKGIGQWTCVPDDPTTPGDIQCAWTRTRWSGCMP